MTPVVLQWAVTHAWERPVANGSMRRLGAALLAVAGAVLLIGVAHAALFAGQPTDFPSFYAAGRAVAHGSAPYPAVASLPAVADRHTFAPFVYPPPVAFLFAPLTLLPLLVAKVVFFLVSVAAVGLGLRLLDVRDVACYAAAFASLPVLEACGIGSVSALLFLGVAAAWRYRDRTAVVALAVAGVVVAKLFLWPLWLWLVYTRRYAAAALAAAAGVLAACAAWAAIGFGGLREYPHLLARLTELTGVNSFSFYALERAFGLPSVGAQLGVAAAGCLLAGLAVWAFGKQRADVASFIAAVGLALLFTPILWPHYLVLLLAPIAIVRPRMSALWLVPLLFWFGGVWSFSDPVRIVPTLFVAIGVGFAALRLAREPRVVQRGDCRDASHPAQGSPASRPSLNGVPRMAENSS